jgi:hypothetical protein
MKHVFTICLSSLLLIVQGNLHAEGNLVRNGGFEEGTTAWEWTVNFGVGMGFEWAAEGRNFGEAYGTLAQNLFTTPGQVYHLSLQLAGNFNIIQTSEIVVHWGGSSLAPIVWSPIGHSISNPGWVRADFSLSAISSTTRLILENPNGFASGRIPRLDAISVTPVPEPSSLVLLTVGTTLAFGITQRSLQKHPP